MNFTHGSYVRTWPLKPIKIVSRLRQNGTTTPYFEVASRHTRAAAHVKKRVEVLDPRKGGLWKGED